MNQYKFIDLFCGLGGFHIALTNTNPNNKCVFACDIDKKCQEVYKNNFNMDVESDITKINIEDIPDFDILCGGFPCQAFSNAGKKKAFNDKRGLLFDSIVDIINIKKPIVCILENVKHIKKVSEGKVYKYIYTQMEKSGYTMTDITISPWDINIPQNRERVIFIAFRNDIIKEKSSWEKILKQYLETNIKKYHIQNKNYKVFSDIKYIDKKYFLKEDILNVLNSWNNLIQELDVGVNISFPITLKYFSEETSSTNKAWKNNYIEKNVTFYNNNKNKLDKWLLTNKDNLETKEIYQKLEWQVGKIKKDDSIYNYYIQLRQSGIRVKKTNYFPTLVAISQIPIYGKEKRYITPRECARLQSLPHDYIFLKNDKDTYKQLGNSVNVNIIQLVWESIESFLEINK